jgi:hypothetical protein
MRTRFSETRCRVGLLAAACLTAAGCTQHRPVPAPVPPPPPPTHWPVGHTPPLKITDQLILEIPLQHERGALSADQGPRRALPSGPSDRAEAQFDFFLPDFSGYTLGNYRNDTDENKVEVVYLHAGNPHEADPDAPGEYPPNMLKRALAEYLSSTDYKDQYGLRCYEGRVPSARLTCYGKRNAAGEGIMLTTLKPPYPVDAFPQLQARYFSQRYGGVRIAWRTHVRNLPRWREIDARIWQLIDAWNVAPRPAGTARPTAPRRAPRALSRS